MMHTKHHEIKQNTIQNSNRNKKEVSPICDLSQHQCKKK